MPELPEVETILRDLRPHVAGRRIVAARASRLLRSAPSPRRLARELPGRTIRRLRRRGKYLLLGLDDGRELLVHLGMTGRLVLEAPARPEGQHLHLALRLTGLDRELRFYDPRRFGRVALGWPRELAAGCGLGRLGVEPLATPERELARLLASQRKRLKAMLLDQSPVAGIGNIYADEALWRARLHPNRVAAALAPSEALRLARAIRSVLREAIRQRGSSVADYVDGSGQPGRFQDSHCVYGREGRSCPRCGAAVVREQIAGRSTHFCPRCQPLSPSSEAALPRPHRR